MAEIGSCGCHQLLTRDEMEGVLAAVFDEPDTGQSAGERQELWRVALKLAADLLRADQPMPARLRVWLGDSLSALHEALETGQESSLTAALSGIGRRPKGNPGKGAKTRRDPSGRDGTRSVDGSPDVDSDAEVSVARDAEDLAERESWRDLGLAAAVAVLADKVGMSRAVQSVAVAVGLSESSVYRACEEVEIDAAHETTPGLAAGDIERVRVSVRRDPHKHTAEICDLMRVTPNASS